MIKLPWLPNESKIEISTNFKSNY